MSVAITPETRIGELLDAYPGVEAALIEMAPAFANLKNPVLRKTVAKIATLEQAARIGGVGVAALLRKLREVTGQSGLEVLNPQAGASGVRSEPPAWLDERAVRHHMDADMMLQRGEHPIGPIRRLLEEAQPGEIVRLTSSFCPAPLIDAMQRSGAGVYTSETAPGRHVTWICARPARG